MWSSHLWRADPASRCSNKCISHYSAYRQEERETDRHVVFLRGEHYRRWDCMTRMSTLSNHRRPGRRIDGLAPSFLHAGATKFSTLQVGQKYQQSGHIDQQSTKWQWNMCCYWLCLSPFLGAEQLWFNSLLRLHEPKYSKSSNYWMSPSIFILSAALLLCLNQSHGYWY